MKRRLKARTMKNDRIYGLARCDFSNFPLVVSPVAFRDKALFVLTVVFRETREKSAGVPRFC